MNVWQGNHGSVTLKRWKLVGEHSGGGESWSSLLYSDRMRCELHRGGHSCLGFEMVWVLRLDERKLFLGDKGQIISAMKSFKFLLFMNLHKSNGLIKDQ